MGIFSIFSKLFGSSDSEASSAKSAKCSCKCADSKSGRGNRGPRRDRRRQDGNASAQKPAEALTIAELEGFVEYVAKSLVDYPDEVVISSEANDDGRLIKIVCRRSDRGKIIGKKGKTIMALRSLVAGAAGRTQDRVSVEVIDDDENEVKEEA